MGREKAQAEHQPLNQQRTRYGFAGFFLLSLLVCWTALRAVLYAEYHPENTPWKELVWTFLIGASRDLLVGSTYCLPLCLWFLWVSNRRFAQLWHRWLLRLAVFFFWLVQIFLLFTEYFFFDEFRSRFNTVAVDYLLFPHEVFINIWDSYPVGKVLVACGAASAVWLWLAETRYRGMWLRPISTKVRLTVVDVNQI